MRGNEAGYRPASVSYRNLVALSHLVNEGGKVLSRFADAGFFHGCIVLQVAQYRNELPGGSEHDNVAQRGHHHATRFFDRDGERLGLCDRQRRVNRDHHV